MVKRREIDDYIDNQKGLNDKQRALLKEKSEQTWFSQYAKKSKENLVKLTRTVKKQIKQNKGGYFSEQRKPEEDKRGHILPKRKGVTKKQVKKEVSKQKLTEAQKAQKRKDYRKLYNQRPEVKEANRIRKANKKKKE